MCYNPSALCDNRTASSAKARKNTYKVAISKIYLIYAAILCSLKYLSRYGYTQSKKIQNNLGEAPSPYFTPVFASKLCFSYPLMHTMPLLLIYILRIIWIRQGGIFNFTAISSHSTLRSTRSYALFRSTKMSPSGDFEQILYYTNYWTIRACSIVV